MKKIILMIIPFTMTLAVLAQDSGTKDIQVKKSPKQKTEAKSQPQTVSILDGKTYKITLTPKEDAMGTAETTPKSKDMTAKDEGNNASKAATTAQTREPVENPDMNQNQNPNSSFADWNNAKGKLRFENGMLRIAMNNKEVATDNCKYNVTSGTADLATFSAGCKLSNGTAMGDNAVTSPATQSGINTGDIGTSPTEQKAKETGNAGRNENTTIENKPANDMNTAKTPVERKDMAEGNDVASKAPKSDDRNVTGQQPSARNMENTNSNTAQTSRQNTMQDQQMKPQAQASAQLNITGFVNGSSISGTIVLYENGKMTSYSFSGTAASRKEAQTLGMLKE